MVLTKYDTFKEINQQPALWVQVFDLVERNKTDLKNLLSELQENNYEVIFIGAGSSLFIGEMVAPIFQKDTGLSSRAVSTTEIVTHAHYFINPARETLLVSLARSGDSPESLAAIEKATQYSSKIKNLVITCNKDGALAKIENAGTTRLIMPEEANDRSLAMTSSVTSMGLAALLFGRINQLEKQAPEVKRAAIYVADFLKKQQSFAEKLATVEIERAVFLGSGPSVGTAHEAHLKLQEMTDGKVIAKFDSYLGFRHGPKVVVNEETMMIYFISNNDSVRKYEFDLIKSIKQNQNPKFCVAISNRKVPSEIDIFNDLNFEIEGNKGDIDEDLWTIASLVPAQVFAFYKSLELGLNPDSPSVSGSIHRVVQGVTIY